MSGPGHSRPLLAARSSSGDASKEGGTTPPAASHRPSGGRPKRTLIESACSACRRRKSRCDGIRPACSRCQNLRTECQYEAEEGESRWSALRRRNQILEQERDQIRELLAFVQMRPEPEALEIFQRIRTSSYDDIFTLLRQVQDNSYASQPNLQHTTMPPATSGSDQRLPPIQTILDVSSQQPVLPSPGYAHHSNHALLVHSHSVSSDDSRKSSIPEYTPGPHGAPLPHLHVLSTLEPSLHPSQQHASHHPVHTPPLVGGKPSLSSEDSTGSMSSNAGYGLDHSHHPYHTP